MTERNVRRVMLVATIGVAGLLTSFAVAGLVVITRGPQVQALPLIRTLIAQDPDGTAAAVTLAPIIADHPPLTWPLLLHTTTTTPTMASLGETSGDSHSAANKSRPTSSGSTMYTYVAPNSPSYSTPPTTSGALTPPASGAPASAPASNVIPRAGAAPSADPPVSTGGPSAVDPDTSTTQPVEIKGEEDPVEPDDDREVISPRLRVNTADDHDPHDPNEPDDPRK
ncbi:MAG: hypothetical protein ACYC33_12975 [Thermoleophilia bacterium]